MGDFSSDYLHMTNSVEVVPLNSLMFDVIFPVAFSKYDCVYVK